MVYSHIPLSIERGFPQGMREGGNRKIQQQLRSILAPETGDTKKLALLLIGRLES